MAEVKKKAAKAAAKPVAEKAVKKEPAATKAPAAPKKAAAAARPSGMSLVVVESPTKAKSFVKYLGPKFIVMASLGHVKDLPKKDLGVDVERDFHPKYEVIATKKKVIAELKAAAKKADAIYLAADPDREGEAICQHLAEELTNGKPVHRILFNEITKQAIQDAVANPGKINAHLVEAQQARRILDRLVGYKISPLLWDKVRRGISAGRVQTVALRLIVEREKEILAFKPVEYWTMDASLAAHLPPNFDARLAKRLLKAPNAEGKSEENIEIHNAEQAQGIEKELHAADFVVNSVNTKEKRRNPVPPFITSKLQQDSARKLHFSVKRTMTVAQRLYEGKEIGDEGSTGLITYMRTDSTRVADHALAEVREFVGREYGPGYLPEAAIIYKTKKDAQDAHEAIRPTSVMRTPESMQAFLTEDELKLYRLIWQRFVASQMLPAIFLQTTIDIHAKDYLFRATGSIPKFDGFLKVYEEGKDAKDEEDEELKHKLPEVKEGEKLKLEKLSSEQHFTEPPPRYNEATLVKDLEERGIGRPSTYASILSVIQDREYVEKRQNRFFPSELGMVVSDLLVENFSDIFDLRYTARMEEELDEVEEGRLEWHEALAEFYGKFAKDLKRAERNMQDIKRMEKPTDQICDKCGKKMVIKWGRHGSFIACTGYPECTNTRELNTTVTDLPDLKKGEVHETASEDYGVCVNCGRPMALKRGRFGQFLACTGYPDCKTTQQLGQKQRKPDVALDEKCPNCGNNLVLKDGRFGEFTACSNYPKCKYVKQKTVGVACPKPGCTGEIAERRSKRGKVFFGCVRYPDCDFVLWDRPRAEKCPKCNYPFMVEKRTKQGQFFKVCPNEECKYKVEIEEEPAASEPTPA